MLQLHSEGAACPAAEEVLRMTPFCQSLREVLPIGFLSQLLLDAHSHMEEELDPAYGSIVSNWVEEVVQRALVMTASCSLSLASHFQNEAGKKVLREACAHISK